MDAFLYVSIMEIQYLVSHFHLFQERDVQRMIAGETDETRKRLVKFFKADSNPLSGGSGMMLCTVQSMHPGFVFNWVGWAPVLPEESLLLSIIPKQDRCSDDRPQLTHAKFTLRATSVFILVHECFLIPWDSLGFPVFMGAIAPVLVPQLCRREPGGGGQTQCR